LRDIQNCVLNFDQLKIETILNFVWRMLMNLFSARQKQYLSAGAVLALLSSGTVRADPMDALQNTEIPRDVSSSNRVERIDVWGARVHSPAAEGLSPLNVVNIGINLKSDFNQGVCINCATSDIPNDEEKKDEASILEDLKKFGKVLWTVLMRSKGGAVRFLFHSAPLGDYCSDKPQDLACQRNPAPSESSIPEFAFSIERHDLTSEIQSSTDMEKATLFGHPLHAVASAIFDETVTSDNIRIDSYIQDDATDTLVFTFSVDLPGSEGAAPTTTSRPPAPPVRVDRHGRVFIEP
jgi:hypothetical protein